MEICMSDLNISMFKLDLPPQVKRQPQNRFDYGDEATIGVYLKTPHEIVSKNSPRRFGRFGGVKEGKFQVGIYGGGSEITQIEEYVTVQDMHAKWQLD
jgi:hypothetical protein